MVLEIKIRLDLTSPEPRYLLVWCAPRREGDAVAKVTCLNDPTLGECVKCWDGHELLVVK